MLLAITATAGFYRAVETTAGEKERNTMQTLLCAPVRAIEIVAGRDASANFDMQSLASLLPGDRITVRRSQHHVRFLHPRGWSYFDTLRRKLHWNEGVA